MPRTAALLALLLPLLTLSTRAEEAHPVLVAEAPAPWIVKNETINTLSVLSAKRTDKPAILIVTPWPVPSRPDQIPQLVQSLARSFLDQTSSQPLIKLKSPDYQTDKIDGPQLKGEYALFHLEPDFIQTMFLLSDGTSTWNGQFTGTPETWTEAINILRTLRTSQ